MIDDERIIREKMRGGDMPLLDRIEAAMHRVTNGEGQMRVPVEATDPDVVLFDCKREIESLRTELAEAKRDAEHLRSESVTLAGILRDCNSVLATIEPESTAEADSMADLRRAIAYALDPYGNTGHLPGIEPRRRIVFACPVCAASLERTP